MILHRLRYLTPERSVVRSSPYLTFVKARARPEAGIGGEGGPKAQGKHGGVGSDLLHENNDGHPHAKRAYKAVSWGASRRPPLTAHTKGVCIGCVSGR